MAVQSVDSSSYPSRREAFAALKSGRLDGLGTVQGVRARGVEPVIATGLPDLDRLLGGGFPCGSLTVLEGNAGCWSVAARVVARVTQRALAAIVDDGGLYPPTLARAGARLDRVLIVPARSALGMARAADILIRSRSCRVVLTTAPELRPAVWARLAALAQRNGVLLVVIASGSAAAPLAAASGVRLLCTRERVMLAGSRGLWSTVAGYVVRTEVRKSKARAAGGSACLRAVTNVCGESLRERTITQRSRSARAALR